MLAPISWLKDYVDITVSPETLARKLVAIGFEVEDIIYQSKKVNKVVVGKILSVEKHPNADRLRVTKTDIGSKVLQIVTNVPVEGGEMVAVALDGAVLADGHTIKRGELRGVLSEGMFCGLEEVGLTVDDVEGQKQGDILRFAEGTKLGINALVALGYDDVVLDVAVTANRPDCNSIYKLAKEVAVALKKDCREPEIHFETKGANVADMVSVRVDNPELCPRYMAGGVRNVKIFSSSQKIKSRLRAVGIRPINNIVDITNYVLIEIGQPMHAFDLRNLGNRSIIVRTAKDGETIVTLDGKKNELKPSMLAICDANGPVAVAGVMGGEFSGIQDDTTQIIFESAKFARDSIRRTSRALNLRSDSSARYEKGIDFASQEYGLKRALTLIYESGSGDIAEGVIDVCVGYEKDRKIPFTVSQIENILGCKVPVAALKSILSRLGIPVTKEGKQWVADVPDARDDIVGVNDLAEEFIRVYGYDHVEPTLFAYSSLTKGGKPAAIEFRDKVKNKLAALGLNECVTYSFTSPTFADKLQIPADSELRRTVEIINPLGEAMSVMRTVLSHSMLEVLSYNLAHFNRAASLFEIAKVYIPESLPLVDLPSERERLVVGMYGESVDFFEIKGILEGLFSTLGIDAEYTADGAPSFLHPGRSATVYANGAKVGFVGEVHPDTAALYDVDDTRLYVAELDMDALCGMCCDVHTFEAFSKYPPVERDLAVVVDDSVLAGDMVKAVREARIADLRSAEVFDIYRSAQIGEGKKSVAMNFTFSSAERTLTDDEVAASMKKILAALKKKVGAKIRV